MKRLILLGLLGVLLTAGCATYSYVPRTVYGPDWLIAAYGPNGLPTRCWKLRNTVVRSQPDGSIEWYDIYTRHLIHIVGASSVEVGFGRFDTAGKALGVDDTRCDNGTYPAGQ